MPMPASTETNNENSLAILCKTICKWTSWAIRVSVCIFRSTVTSCHCIPKFIRYFRSFSQLNILVMVGGDFFVVSSTIFQFYAQLDEFKMVSASFCVEQLHRFKSCCWTFWYASICISCGAITSGAVCILNSFWLKSFLL